MAISSVGSGSFLGQSIQSINNRLTDLQSQLASGKKSPTYAGMGVNEGFAIAARVQLANLSAFTDTMTNVNTTISVANTALQALAEIGKKVQSAASNSLPTVNASGQSMAQQIALSQFSTMLGVLNTQAGDRYVFSGSATNAQSVASADAILNGTPTQAGLKKLIEERQEADLGTTPFARLTLSAPIPTTVELAEDGSPFGLKLDSIISSLTGATVSPPAGAPPSASIDLGATNPNDGDQVTFKFKLPDGTIEVVQLTASSASPPPAGSFEIGATSDDTATNLNAALGDAIKTIGKTALVAASAMAATDSFFSSSPQRVNGSPANAAMSLRNATAADTVSWYTGEAGAGSARATSIARVDQSITVQYGARANEEAIVTQVKAIAVLAAVQTAPSNPDANAQVAALTQRVTQNLSMQPGRQTIQDIQADFAGAQTTMKDAAARQTQAQSMLKTMVDQAESVSTEQVISQILALQTSLQASYQVTSMLSQLSLVKFL